MTTEYIHLPFEIKAADEQTGKVQGYGAIFGNVDFGLDRIEPGAFKDSLKKRAKSNPLPMLWQHNDGQPIGVWESAYEDSKGLFVDGRLNLSKESGQADVPLAWQARALIKQGAVKGLSIGYWPVDYKYEGDVRVLHKVEVIEVSMATFPMNPRAQIANVKRWTNKECVQELRERLGLTRNEAEAFRAGGLKALREYVGVRESEDVLQGANNLLAILKGTKT